MKFQLHPNFGQYTIENDILVTPFLTEELCQEIVQEAEKRTDEFVYARDDVNYLYLSDISRELVLEFATLYKQAVIPMLKKEWMVLQTLRADVPGLFSPYIAQYKMHKNKKIDQHTDPGLVTLNVRLNDGYEGCHLYFPRQKWSAKDVPVGTGMFWPGLLTHPHYTDDLKSGTKFTLVSFSWPPEDWFDPRGVAFRTLR